MKKRILTILASMLLIGQMIPTTAYAANENSASTKVFYTYSKENNYELEIPAELNLNMSDTCFIRVTSVILEDGYGLQVSVNTATFSKGDNECMILSLTTNIARQMPCQLFTRDTSSGTETAVTSENNVIVTFRDGDTYNSRHGELKIVPDVQGRSLPSGDYKGTLYFDIAIIPIQ